MRRWIIVAAALAVLVLLALPIWALYYAAFTEPGLQLVAGLIPHRVGGVEIRTVGVRGTAAYGVHLDLLEIDQERVHLRFEGIEGRVALAPLLLQTLRVPDARVARALIEIRHRDHPGRPTPWHFLPYWLEIRADRVRIAEG
jgi:hypothetical protein